MSSDQPAKAAAETAASAKDDGDLSDLLDEALKDFGKKSASQPASKEGGAGAGSADAAVAAGMFGGLTPEQLAEIGNVPAGVTPEMAQRAAADFHNMLTQLSRVQEAAMKTNQAAPGTLLGEQKAPIVAEGDGAETAVPSEEDAAAFLANLNQLAEKAQNVASANNAEEFMSRMDEFHENSMNNELMPFMHGLMTSLMSKDMMYPSIKEMVDKYPAWLEENKSKVSAEEHERYSAQLSIMQQLCSLYEEEKDEDSDDVRMDRFDKIMMHMQQMQMCGHPPADLVGAMPPGWNLDPSSGLPQVTDSQAAAENCSVM